MVNTEGWPEDRYIVKEAKHHDDGWWTITSVDGWGFGINADEAEKAGYDPKPGDEIILYGGIGKTIKGIVINGHVFRYKTRAQDEAERQEWLENYQREKEERYEANIEDWTERKDALPEPYLSRMNRFISRDGAKEFWTEDGGYELFILEQSAMMVEWAKYWDDTTQAADALDWFKDQPWEKQKQAMPNLSDDHSGNTFGGAVALARAVLQEQEI